MINSRGEARVAFAALLEVRLFYECSGLGDPLVLIPGWTLNTRLWDLVLPDFERWYRVVRYDPRGAGRSTSDPSLEHSRPSDAEDLLGLLDFLGIGKAHLVGHSKGARIAFALAVNRPERVASVIAVGSAEPHGREPGSDTHLPGADRWFDSVRLAARERGLKAAMGAIKEGKLFGPMRADAGRLALLKRAMEGYAASDLLSDVPARRCDYEAEVPRLAMPLLYLCGGLDPFLVECEYAHGRVPGSRLEVLQGCGHMPMLEAPEAFSRAVIAFLDDQGG